MNSFGKGVNYKVDECNHNWMPTIYTDQDKRLHFCALCYKRTWKLD